MPQYHTLKMPSGPPSAILCPTRMLNFGCSAWDTVTLVPCTLPFLLWQIERPCHERGKELPNYRLECALVRKESTAHRKTRVPHGTATADSKNFSSPLATQERQCLRHWRQSVYNAVLCFKNLKVQALLAANTFPTTADRKASPHPNRGRRGQSD